MSAITRPAKLRDAIRQRADKGVKAPALPETPPGWRDHAVRLLACPGLDPFDASALRAWIAWRVLPRTYWARLQAIAARTAPAPRPQSSNR